MLASISRRILPSEGRSLRFRLKSDVMAVAVNGIMDASVKTSRTQEVLRWQVCCE